MLNGTKEDVQALKGRMEERRLRARLEKVTRAPRARLPASSGPPLACSSAPEPACPAWSGGGKDRAPGIGQNAARVVGRGGGVFKKVSLYMYIHSRLIF